MSARRLVWLGAIGAALAVAAACTTDIKDCPAKTAITPGASCDHDDLQCPYDLASASPACDGTQATIETSCTCTKGAWSCPDPVACEAGPTEEAGPADDAGSDGD